MKMAAAASYRAVPSMLTVAPTGRVKRETFSGTFRFSVVHIIVTGSVAAEEVVVQQVSARTLRAAAAVEVAPGQKAACLLRTASEM